MSDVPLARLLLHKALAAKSLDEAQRLIARAIPLMHREEYVRRAPAKRKVIDQELRRRVKRLAHTNPNMTMHQIADAVGLRSSGRVSEVMHGKR